MKINSSFYRQAIFKIWLKKYTKSLQISIGVLFILFVTQGSVVFGQ